MQSNYSVLENTVNYIHDQSISDNSRDIITIMNEMKSIKTSFQAGCSIIASAITAKGIPTASNAAPYTMATNISNIVTGNSEFVSGTFEYANLTTELWYYDGHSTSTSYGGGSKKTIEVSLSFKPSTVIVINDGETRRATIASEYTTCLMINWNAYVSSYSISTPGVYKVTYNKARETSYSVFFNSNKFVLPIEVSSSDKIYWYAYK